MHRTKLSFQKGISMWNEFSNFEVDKTPQEGRGAGALYSLVEIGCTMQSRFALSMIDRANSNQVVFPRLQ